MAGAEIENGCRQSQSMPESLLEFEGTRGERMRLDDGLHSWSNLEFEVSHRKHLQLDCVASRPMSYVRSLPSATLQTAPLVGEFEATNASCTCSFS